jgi:Trypsin-co-occurring domain 1
MKRMMEVPLQGEDKGSILMEVELDESEQQRMVPAARPGELAAKAKQTFEEALDEIKPVANVMVDKLRTVSAKPAEISVTFGLMISASAGAFIAASGVEANFTVLLKWNHG